MTIWQKLIDMYIIHHYTIWSLNLRISCWDWFIHSISFSYHWGKRSWCIAETSVTAFCKVGCWDFLLVQLCFFCKDWSDFDRNMATVKMLEINLVGMGSKMANCIHGKHVRNWNDRIPRKNDNFKVHLLTVHERSCALPIKKHMFMEISWTWGPSETITVPIT